MSKKEKTAEQKPEPKAKPDKKRSGSRLPTICVKENENSLMDMLAVLRPCTVIRTVNSCHVISKKMGQYMLSGEGDSLTLSELNFVKNFRQHFIKVGKNLKYTKEYRYKFAKFFGFNMKKGIFKDVVQIDMNRAYPTGAKLLKIIDQDLYDKSLKFSKKALLIAIGSLHRRRRKYQIDKYGRRTMLEQEKRIPYLSDMWYSITNFVDQQIRDVFSMLGDNAYFYWCDAIFCTRDRADFVMKEFKRRGFDSKIVEIKYIEYQDEQVFSWPVKIEPGDEPFKPYTYPKQPGYFVKNDADVFAKLAESRKPTLKITPNKKAQ